VHTTSCRYQASGSIPSKGNLAQSFKDVGNANASHHVTRPMAQVKPPFDPQFDPQLLPLDIKLIVSAKIQGQTQCQ
jgi:hypothetical protein